MVFQQKATPNKVPKTMAFFFLESFLPQETLDFFHKISFAKQKRFFLVFVDLFTNDNFFKKWIGDLGSVILLAHFGIGDR